MASSSENHSSIIGTTAYPLGTSKVRTDENNELEKAGWSKSKELIESANKTSISCYRRISSCSAAEHQSRTDPNSCSWQEYPSKLTQSNGDAIEDAAGGTIATPVANTSHDIRALAQLYHSSRRSRNPVSPGNAAHQPSLRSLTCPSSSSGSQQIWNEMQDANSSTEIDEWAFTIASPICKSYSTNSLSSMESERAVSSGSVTAGELFDEDFFERH
ncbi:hypothetical protein ACHAW5_003205 [Stephanodiscus triporus]|uniref:Uncharacterized protein n=1 Tax=Stephanodiscus triporus TaxID=2934178 RepID=A0ABD3P821_9STRA